MGTDAGRSRFPDRVADAITASVGSWKFVIFHIVWFGVWIGLPVESFPYGLLTMVVSLEAIFLSTFIMMSENRQSGQDRAAHRLDLETDLQAEREIRELKADLAADIAQTQAMVADLHALLVRDHAANYYEK